MRGSAIPFIDEVCNKAYEKLSRATGRNKLSLSKKY